MAGIIRQAGVAKKISSEMRPWLELRLRVVEKAVEDWRELCDGKKETRDHNFEELEEFFDGDCWAKFYLKGTGISVERIYRQLCLERDEAMGRRMDEQPGEEEILTAILQVGQGNNSEA